MTKKYQVTELDKVVEQVKGFSEWTNEDQLEHQLRFQEESHKKALERMAVKNAELYTDNVLLKREVAELETNIKRGMKFIQKDLSEILSLNEELEEYRKLKSEVHSDIEKVWMYDATLTKDLSAYQKRKRSEAIERVFYKIANQWI
jgi:chromosome segregation ATPase